MSTTPLCSDREEPRESKADGGSSVKPSRCYSVNSVGKDETSWIDGILSLDLAESIPVVGVSIAAITICTTFTLFFATGKTTENPISSDAKAKLIRQTKDQGMVLLLL
mmetsp:Transcript_23637/g.37953  ORF Transcript_23637/g.37953 Transcript_23637/m.37953 type:complete len:108 (+) Transcript_23637:43-366(+)|eukprot:jgi/Bigna1/63328/fgenesh1_kg.51_\